MQIDNKSKENKEAEEEQGIVQGMEEKEPNPETTGPEQNFQTKSCRKMNDKSQESKEPA